VYANYGSATGPGVSDVYDTLGRATSETSVGKTLSYQYDAASNRTRVTWPETGANALYVQYVYDDRP
jgi:YD repeat-containing protein